MLKILILVDGSECSGRAVRYVVEMSGHCREPAELHLLNVQPEIASGNVQRFVGHDELTKFYHDSGIDALASARKILDRAGQKYAFHIGLGDAAETAARYVREKAIDQVVMGTRGLGSIAGMIMGSVALKVMHVVDVPILLVK